MPVCRFFMSGDCANGDYCRFQHPSRAAAAHLVPPPTGVSSARNGGGWQQRRGGASNQLPPEAGRATLADDTPHYRSAASQQYVHQSQNSTAVGSAWTAWKKIPHGTALAAYSSDSDTDQWDNGWAQQRDTDYGVKNQGGYQGDGYHNGYCSYLDTPRLSSGNDDYIPTAVPRGHGPSNGGFGEQPATDRWRADEDYSSAHRVERWAAEAGSGDDFPPALQNAFARLELGGEDAARPRAVPAAGSNSTSSMLACEVCGRAVLDPHDAAQQAQHTEECSRRHARITSRLETQTLECGICLEVIMQKQVSAERQFGLLKCDHPFCLKCIRGWRTNADASAADLARTCPVCRAISYYVTPSTVWPTTREQREGIIASYKNRLSDIDCRHFNYGEGSCRFGTSCFYRHRLADGTMWRPNLRHVDTADGTSTVMQPVQLSSFLDVRAARRTVPFSSRR